MTARNGWGSRPEAISVALSRYKPLQAVTMHLFVGRSDLAQVPACFIEENVYRPKGDHSQTTGISFLIRPWPEFASHDTKVVNMRPSRNVGGATITPK